MPQPTLLCEGCVTNQVDQSFSLWQGLSQIHQQQLLNFSQTDPLITQNTGDQLRFASALKLNEWLNGQRIIYALTPQNDPNELSGLIWFSQEDLPVEIDNPAAKDAHWTFAIRLYERARGNRLSIPFMTKTFSDFWQKNPNEIVWLSTNASNQISQKIYTQFGFQQLSTKGDKLFYVIKPRASDV
jgi:hypothetical protein